MGQQLVLLETCPADWRLDPRTVARGKAGVSAAREALRESAVRAEQRRARAKVTNPAAAA